MSAAFQVDFDILTEIILARRADILRFLEQGRLYITRCLLRSALLHLVRSSLDHGLEPSDERRILRKTAAFN